MAQVTDYEITASDARSGAEYRQAVNLTLEAIVTQNSGGTAPSVTYPFMKWVDTGTNYIYERDVTNSVWTLIGHITDGEVVYNDHTHDLYVQKGAVVISDVDGLQTALDAKAPLSSPTFSGIPTAPTAVAETNTTQIATTAFVKAKSELDSIGVAQSWVNVTASRAANVTYTNTTGSPIAVLITQTTTDAANSFSVGGTSVYQNYEHGAVSGSLRTPCLVIVPSGSSYIASGTWNIAIWAELR